MTEKIELLQLADKCRSLSIRMDDESTITSLNRLAEAYETQAKVIDYLRGAADRPASG